MTEQELSYQEVMAALPGYATGLLNDGQRAAVDSYLQQQIHLFQHLDELERASGVHAGEETKQPRKQSASYAQAMEGEAAQQMPTNPLFMRNAPQSYTDPKTGQRFVIPRRGTLQQERVPRSFPTAPERRRDRLRRFAWNLLAVAAVVAVFLILANQLLLQRQLTAAQAQLDLMQQAEQILPLRSQRATTATRGAFFMQGQQALLTAAALAPLPPTQVYQLWYRTEDGTLYNGGVLTPLDDGSTQHLLTLAIPAARVTTTEVSIEPAGGSVAPTGEMVLAGMVIP